MTGLGIKIDHIQQPDKKSYIQYANENVCHSKSQEFSLLTGVKYFKNFFQNLLQIPDLTIKLPIIDALPRLVYELIPNMVSIQRTKSILGPINRQLIMSNKFIPHFASFFLQFFQLPLLHKSLPLRRQTRNSTRFDFTISSYPREFYLRD